MKITRLEAAIATVAVALLIVPALLPASLWFSAIIRVPDHRVGDNPIVQYQRIIRKFAVLTWNVEIVRDEAEAGKQQYCVGSGVNIYAPDEAKSSPLPLAKFAGVERCDLPSGRYVMNTCWHWSLWGIYPKAFCTQSNRFIVNT